ncbi:hypothetical protein B0H13DRAFT_2031750 [Mycena leptocephala]|nr:hypothetical protein B0H13DRAFT_2031750 [Mycena leptocephala]
MFRISLGLGGAPEYPFADATIVSNSTIQQLDDLVGDAQVLMTGFSRGSESNTGHTPDTGSTLAARTARNVCGETCTLVTCLGSSAVPGSGSDCAIIADAIEILSAQLGPTYLLNSTNGYLKQLTFGRCVTLIGVSAQEDTLACWSDWSSIIGQLLSACPTKQIGGCTSFPTDLGFGDFTIDVRRS